MSKLSYSEKNKIEEDFMHLSITKLKRNTPAGRVYNGVRYSYRHFKVGEQHESGYYNPEDNSDFLVAVRNIHERVALAKCLAYLEMLKKAEDI